MALPTIQQLNDELVTLVKSVDAFKNAGFSVFDVNDLDDKRGREVLPVAGVAYEGCENQTLASTNVAERERGVAMISMQFSVIISVEYRFSGQDNSSRVSAHALLDDLRRTIQGYKGVNARAWRYIGERPIDEASGDGVVYYGQVWQTTLPAIGNFNQG